MEDILHKKLNFIFINISNAASLSAINKAKTSAKNSNKGVLPTLKSTESNYKWVLLYDHARVAQIAPSVMWRMRRSDLEYLAGMTFAHPDLIAPKGENESDNAVKLRHEEATKMQGNAVRAQNELHKRNLIWAALLAAFTTIGGVLLAARLRHHR